MFKTKDYIVVVPARYSSKRLPGKPLKIISGIPMIIRTCLMCLKVIDKSRLIVASDDRRIINYLQKYKLAMITSKNVRLGRIELQKLLKK